MEKNDAAQKLEAHYPGVVLQKAPFGRAADPSFWVESRALSKVAKFLACDSGLSLDWLENFSVSQHEDAFVFTYFVRSRGNDSRIVLRASVVPASEEALLEIPSVSDVWPMALRMEDEAAEMFGVSFEGRTGTASAARMLPEGWRGYPLRKSYVFPTEVFGIEHGIKDRGQDA